MECVCFLWGFFVLPFLLGWPAAVFSSLLPSWRVGCEDTEQVKNITKNVQNSLSVTKHLYMRPETQHWKFILDLVSKCLTNQWSDTNTFNFFVCLVLSSSMRQMFAISKREFDDSSLWYLRS